jgi:hypothetical protein
MTWPILAGIGHHRMQIDRQVQLMAQPGAAQGFPHHPVEERRQVAPLPVQQPALGEGDELLGELPAGQCGLLGLLQPSDQLLARHALGAGQAEVQHDAGEEVVEVMRDAAREDPGRLQLVHDLVDLLGLLPAGDVADDDDEARVLGAPALFPGQGELEPFPLRPDGQLVFPPDGPTGRVGLLQGRLADGHHLGRQHLGELLAQEDLRRHRQQVLARGAVAVDPSVQAPLEQQVGERIEDAGQLILHILRLHQRIPDAPQCQHRTEGIGYALGDVAEQLHLRLRMQPRLPAMVQPEDPRTAHRGPEHRLQLGADLELFAFHGRDRPCRLRTVLQHPGLAQELPEDLGGTGGHRHGLAHRVGPGPLRAGALELDPPGRPGRIEGMHEPGPVRVEDPQHLVQHGVEFVLQAVRREADPGDPGHGVQVAQLGGLGRLQLPLAGLVGVQGQPDGAIAGMGEGGDGRMAPQGRAVLLHVLDPAAPLPEGMELLDDLPRHRLRGSVSRIVERADRQARQLSDGIAEEPGRGWIGIDDPAIRHAHQQQGGDEVLQDLVAQQRSAAAHFRRQRESGTDRQGGRFSRFTLPTWPGGNGHAASPLPVKTTPGAMWVER